MTVEYLPVDIACNLKCDYCYQRTMREASNISTPNDWERAKREILRLGQPFTVFGGEPLLTPFEHLKEVFEFGLKTFGRNGIQTNGLLVEDRHIELFKEMKVGVGVSIDGPPELNDARGTREEADTINKNILKMVKAGLSMSLIVTIHRGNAGDDEKLELLMKWLSWIELIGIRHVNLHMLETEKCGESLQLTEEENTYAFTVLYHYSLRSKLTILPFHEIRQLLTGDGQVGCIWNGCDPLTTGAVQGVSRSGVMNNCGRTNKDGVNWVKADKVGKERYVVLFHTPQEFGGCADCRFFAFCKGQCPGTAIDGDWRNRSVHCSTWYHLFELVEREVVSEHRMPRSRDKHEMNRIIERLLQSGGSYVNVPHSDWHCDSDIESEGTEVKWL